MADQDEIRHCREVASDYVLSLFGTDLDAKAARALADLIASERASAREEAVPSANASSLYGLTMVPIALYAEGEITSGRLRECIGEWLAGKREWTPADFGMRGWAPSWDESPLDMRARAFWRGVCAAFAESDDDRAERWRKDAAKARADAERASLAERPVLLGLARGFEEYAAACAISAATFRRWAVGP